MLGPLRNLLWDFNVYQVGMKNGLDVALLQGLLICLEEGLIFHLPSFVASSPVSLTQEILVDVILRLWQM